MIEMKNTSSKVNGSHEGGSNSHTKSLGGKSDSIDLQKKPCKQIFNSDNLPEHHYDTVKQWLLQLRNEISIFAKRFDKKIDRTKSNTIFSDKFELDDINESFNNFYHILGSSISGLEGFRQGIDDYVLTWKAIVNGDCSDSSVEVVGDDKSDKIENIDVDSSDESSEEVKTSKEPKTDLKNTVDLKNEDSQDSKPDQVSRIRVRNVFELNKLTADDLSKESNTTPIANTSLTSSLNGSEAVEATPVNVSCTEVSSSDEEPCKPVRPSLRSLKSKESQEKSKEKGKQSNSHLKKEEDKKSPNDVAAVVILSDDSGDEKPKTQPVKTPINWDSSTDDSESERDWVVKNKKKSLSEKADNSTKKKKLLKKKERSKKIKKESLESDEDEKIMKLCKLDNLNRKRKINSSSNSDTPGSDKEKKPVKKKSLKKESKEDKTTLSECFNSDGSVSTSSEMNFELDFVNKLRTFRPPDNVAGMEEFGKIVSDSDDGLQVLTDSSLDSIVQKLSKKEKIVRGTKKKKEGDKKTTLRRRIRDKLLDTKLSDTDTTEGEEKYLKHKMKTRIVSSDSDGEGMPKGEGDSDGEVNVTPQKSKETKRKCRKPRKTVFSDADDSSASDASENEKSDEEKEDEDMKEDSEEEKQVNKRKRKRIQRQSDSSDDDANTPSKSDGKGRKNIRKVLKEESLEKTTKEALKEEEERKQRIAQKQKLYNDLIKKVTEEVKVLDELVLDFDVETKEPLVSVDKDLVRKLKPHQAQGVKFMWDSCFESVKEAAEGKGSGCILAHCMGLGKTLQVITLVHTLLTSEKVDVNRVLIVCPFSTVQNWVNEFRKWLKDVGSGEDFEVYNMIKTAVNHRSYQLRDWERTGGVMVLGYNMFRTLVTPKGRMKAALKKAIEEVLLDPGPDVVVCDEGHILKNEKTAIAKAMSKLRTRRRIVLTGTPLQNNLIEYHCMVQFVKPNLLGTRKEFQNRFVAPIQNGQFEDSTSHDVKIMKRRAHVLHKMLDGIVQRKDYNVLTPYLPPKYEYVIHVKLTDVQCKLYRHYLDVFARKSKNEGGGLFQDFQHLLRICTHPRSLLIHSDKAILRKEYDEDESEGSLKDFIDDGSDSEKSTSGSGSDESQSSASSRSKTPPRRKNTRASRAAGNVSSSDEEEVVPKRTEWWSEMVTEEELCDIRSSAKLFLFFTILKHCEEIGDKLLVFSQSLYTLDLIEHFLNLIDENNRKSEDERNPLLNDFNSNWDKGIDYFRLDGGTSSDNRASWCKVFNQASNTRGRLFLISTRAGGLGINLTGANRVIIFDASWNPSFDVQSIFRVYRFGQEKPCYIYRFLSKGTMEEKIYERQVAKLSTSLRVIDEQQIDRHFTQTSLAELYAFNPDAPEERETPILPKDRLMAELVQSYSDLILKHHQHDSLLENQEDEELNEEERKAAWVEFENEKNNVPPPPNPYFMNMNMNANFIAANNNSFALQYRTIFESVINKIKLSDPSISDEILKERALQIMQAMPFFQSYQGMQMQGGVPMQNMQGGVPMQNAYPQFNMQQQLINQQVRARQMQIQQQQQILQAQQMMSQQQLLNNYAKQLQQQNKNVKNGPTANFSGSPNLAAALNNKNITLTPASGTEQQNPASSRAADKSTKSKVGASSHPIEINDDE